MYFSLNMDILPHISYINKAVTPKNWLHFKRTSSEYILFIIISGEMYLQEDENRYILRQNDYIFLLPGHTHFGYQEAQCEYYYIHFQNDCLTPWDCHEIPQIIQIISDNNKVSYMCDPFTDDLYNNYRLFLPKDLHIYSQTIMEQIKLHMNEAVLATQNQLPHFKLNCSSCFLNILTLISRDFVSHILPQYKNREKYEKLKKVHALLNYIHTNYTQNITGNDISDMFNINFDSLNRIFKQETGFPIFHYIKKIRLMHAKELLSTTQLKLSEISELTGFCDQYYFSRIFKQEFGISPKKYALLSSQNDI